MQTYELLYLTPLQDAEDRRTAIRERVGKVIQDAGGAIAATRDIARQRLSYPIRKQQAGEYALVEFTVANRAVAEIERELRLLPEILRLMVTTKLEKARAVGHELDAMERARAQEDAAKAAAAERVVTAPAPVAEPAAIEDLDKRLEEILGKEMV